MLGLNSGRISRLCTWAVFTLLCMFLPAATCGAGEQMPFKASVHGFAEPPVDLGGNFFQIVVSLTGHGTHIGDFDVYLDHLVDFNTLTFSGVATFTAANGDTFHTEFSGFGFPPDAQGWMAFEVTHTIVGGTGRFNGATGTFFGVNGRFNLATGEDVAGYAGTISSPGSAKK